MAGTLTITSTTITGATGTKMIGPLFLTAANPILQTDDYSITAAGSTTITPPIGASIALIAAPVTNLIQLILKGITGDTGLSFLNFALWQIFNPSSPSPFVLTSLGAITGLVEVTSM